jgi:NADH-quinone oxidoreductase subunit B
MEGLVLLQDAVGSERRPLSWAVGEQRVDRPQGLSQRDRKHAERVAMRDLTPPDRVR